MRKPGALRDPMTAQVKMWNRGIYRVERESWCDSSSRRETNIDSACSWV